MRLRRKTGKEVYGMAFYSFQVKSKVLGYPVEVSVCLPDEGRDIPVLWLMHGANSEYEEWYDQTSLIRYAGGRNLAFVTTSTYNGFNVNMSCGAAYADFLEQEWVETVRSLFPALSVKREKNYLAGASMGGFGACRLAVNRPDLFCKVGSFAGSIEMPTIVERNSRGIQPGGADFGWAFGGYENMINNSNDVIYMAKTCVEKGVMPEVYMICGTEDFGYALNTIARDDLRMVGARVIWREVPGVHSYDCWDPELPRFLDWLEEADGSSEEDIRSESQKYSLEEGAGEGLGGNLTERSEEALGENVRDRNEEGEGDAVC